MTIFSAFPALRHWCDRRVRTGDFFILAALIALSPLFFTNDYWLAPRLLKWIFFPAAVLLLLFMSGDVGSRRTRLTLEIEFRIVLRIFLIISTILVAAFVYLLSMNISSWRQPGAILRVVDQQWAFAGMILLFMLSFAFAVRVWPEFLPRFVTAFSTMVAASALYNISVFFSETKFNSVWQANRLVNSLGMPGYTNSTNISVTYALLFVCCAAVIVDGRRSRLMRYWLLPVSMVLFSGVLLTQARSAYVSILVGLGVLLWTSLRGLPRKLLVYLVCAIAFLAIIVVLVPQTRAVVAFRGDSHRPEIWKLYAMKASENPLLGYGGLSNIDTQLGNGMVIDQPHNLVLSAQIRGGIFCALAMIVMLVGSLYWSMRFLKLRGEVLPLAMIATIATAGMFDYNLLITAVTWPWVTFWLPFSICAGAEIVVRQCSQASA